MTNDPYTILLNGVRFWLGNITEPSLSEMLWEYANASTPHDFYTSALRLVHRSLRFANAEIEDDDGSISLLASLVTMLSPEDVNDTVSRIVEFSKRANARLAGMVVQ
jgi:hypothetical protein